MTDSFEDSVIKVLTDLAPGEIVSYRDVAEQAGFPGAARAVGNILAGVEGLPWWRVVTVNGRLVPGHERRQTKLLGDEGVSVRDGRVVA